MKTLPALLTALLVTAAPAVGQRVPQEDAVRMIAAAVEYARNNPLPATDRPLPEGNLVLQMEAIRPHPRASASPAFLEAVEQLTGLPVLPRSSIYVRGPDGQQVMNPEFAANVYVTVTPDRKGAQGVFLSWAVPRRQSIRTIRVFMAMARHQGEWRVTDVELTMIGVS